MVPAIVNEPATPELEIQDVSLEAVRQQKGEFDPAVKLEDPFNLEELDFGDDLRQKLLEILTGDKQDPGSIILTGFESNLTDMANSASLAGTEADGEIPKESEPNHGVEIETEEEVTPKEKHTPYQEVEVAEDGEVLSVGEDIEKYEEVRRVQLMIGPSGVTKIESTFTRPIGEQRIEGTRVFIRRSDAA